VSFGFRLGIEPLKQASWAVDGLVMRRDSLSIGLELLRFSGVAGRIEVSVKRFSVVPQQMALEGWRCDRDPQSIGLDCRRFGLELWLMALD